MPDMTNRKPRLLGHPTDRQLNDPTYAYGRLREFQALHSEIHFLEHETHELQQLSQTLHNQLQSLRHIASAVVRIASHDPLVTACPKISKAISKLRYRLHDIASDPVIMESTPALSLKVKERHIHRPSVREDPPYRIETEDDDGGP